MPIKDYFKNHGKKVMKSMKKEYGDEEGKKIFYATANKDAMKLDPSDDAKKRMFGKNKKSK